MKTIKNPKILILNGPNLHLLGKREPGVYGLSTLKELEESLDKKAREFELEVDHFQSNSEGEIVDRITTADFDFLIINPAAYTHTSVAVRDAISGVGKPAIEVHISNVHKREDFRKISLISDVVEGTIIGLGTYGYILAIEAADRMLRGKQN